MNKFSKKSKTQKLYRFEIDQSVRIEELNRDSTIGIANKDHSYTISLSRRVKRRLHEHFRRQGKSKQFGPHTFAAGIICALQEINLAIHDLIIDIEYPGYEQQIIDLIQIHFPEVTVYFTRVGRKSPAHYAAYGVYIRRRKTDRIASTRDILQTLKNGFRTVTPLDKARRFAVHNKPFNRYYN
ncbi:MAG: hypothetical protein ABIH36_01785 [bacterium]